ncbi:MAG TPA: hypothetical protein VHL08_06350 [Dongiaceae bacterium]|jgi:cell shape-determining protein MreD|nr:hypothetical protein [Dongiaceae bacterium]
MKFSGLTRSEARRIALLSTPVLISIGILFVSILPWHFNAMAPGALVPILPAIYYWVLHHPRAMPLGAVFLLGLVSDVLGMDPLGVGILTYLAAYGAGALLRRHIRDGSLPLAYAGLAIVAVFSHAVGWLAASVALGRWIGLEPALFLVGIDLMTYPFMAYVFARAQRAWLVERRA